MHHGIRKRRTCDTIYLYGEVQEWLNWHAWNACRGAIFSRVRIPLSPPRQKDSLIIYTHVRSRIARLPLLEAVSFITGFALLSFELAAARVMAPSIGSSTYVYTSVIGVIIAALALGFFIGGQLADRRNNQADVAYLLLAGAVATTYTLLSYESTLQVIVDTFNDQRVQGIWAAISLFAPTSFIIGMTSPYLSKLKVQNLGETGRSIASLDACNSFGGITGTFVTGFILFGFIGSRATFILIILLLLCVSWCMAPSVRPGLRLAVTGAVLLMALTPVEAKAGATELDTPSAHYTVINGFYENQPITGLVTGPGGIQSAVYTNGNTDLVFWYTREMAAQTIERQPKSILLLGGGAFTLAQDLAEKLPSTHIDVVEIDPSLRSISEKYFNYKNPANVRLIFEDARTYVNRADANYDVILVDTYGDTSIPFSLITQEYGRTLARRLKPNGTVLLNLIAGTTPGPCRDLFSAINAAYQGSLPYATYARNPASDARRSNIIVMYGRTPFTQTGYTTPPAPRTAAYTDDFVPAERLYQSCNQLR